MKKSKKSSFLFLLGIGLLGLGCYSEPTSVVLVVIGIVLIALSIILDF